MPDLSAPEAQADATTDDLAVAGLLKQASLFASINSDRLLHLAGRMERQVVAEGTIVARQGETGDTCYVLRSGRVEVLLGQTGKAERCLATLYPGALFGEAALLTGEPRNATVRALERCELLTLRRPDLLDVMNSNQGVASEILGLLHLRDRPRRVAGVVAHLSTGSDVEKEAILKDPKRGTYYRLSAQGWFIWERLDGLHTLRDITIDYFVAFKSIAPQAVAASIAGLVASGFASCPGLRADVTNTGTPAHWRATFLMASRRLLDCRLAIRNVDLPLTKLYNRGAHLLYARPAQAVLGILALAGLLRFATGAGQTDTAVQQSSEPLLVILVACVLAPLVHEAGHAFTVKAFGREVPRVGLGWYWLGPMAFVDTTDMWLAGRWQRVAVSLAGPYANALLAAVAVLASGLVPSPTLAAALWQFALISYLMVLINLNPLLEYDGYYVLMDALERPNLRSASLSWIRRQLPLVWRDPAELSSHWLELAYGFGSLFYAAALAWIAQVLYRLYLEDWVAQALRAETAEALAWAVAGVALAISAVQATSGFRDSSRCAVQASLQ